MITSSGCCSGGANRRTGSRRVGRGPWAVGGGVWLRSPQLRVECLLMKSYHQIWAEDCDSFSYEGHKTKNFMEQFPFVERGECHRVGAGRPHRGSKEGDHNEDC